MQIENMNTSIHSNTRITNFYEVSDSLMWLGWIHFNNWAPQPFRSLPSSINSIF